MHTNSYFNQNEKHNGDNLVEQVNEKKVSSEEQLHFSRGAPGSAKGCTALLFAALKCFLVPFLLVNNVLNNSTLSIVKDPAHLYLLHNVMRIETPKFLWYNFSEGNGKWKDRATLLDILYSYGN